MKLNLKYVAENKVAFAAFLLSFALTFGVPAAARASGSLDPALYFTMGEARVEQLPDVSCSVMGMYPLTTPSDAGGWIDGINEANMILDQIINMGKKIWVIVESNKPVVNIATDTASALPDGARSWQSLQGWQTPVSKVFRVTYENLYGAKVVEFTYRLLYTYGGNVSGKGRYLTNVTVVPADLSVSWGYTFNMNAAIPSITNAGTSADPVAGAQVSLAWKVNTVFKHTESTQNYYVQGDGKFSDLNVGN